ncbi:MAG: tRNA nucleotidyltransferase/poly(A) polymerase [Amphiamblys sp. WSBS2006]|nr:MAG: tRNA nucleotidyltransferase/poly(A) polymerase [Amphiamblys sp. WSBS2006]
MFSVWTAWRRCTLGFVQEDACLRVCEKIVLDAGEEEIVSFLDRFRAKVLPTATFRIAGGWVRDKLLNKSNKDIDIAIDTITGAECINLLKTYSEENGIEGVGGLFVARLNPEKSKNLETASLKLFGRSVDFVGLRKEKYTEHTRIPTVEEATPLEDALRRDITINALFYNINTGEVEDLIGKGLPDLRAERIRTTVPPMVTFMNDPLRILRVVRFGIRFGFQIDPEIKTAIQSVELRKAFLKKISRERVVAELEGMMSHSVRSTAKYITEYNLHTLLFPEYDAVTNEPMEDVSFAGRENAEILDRFLLLDERLCSREMLLGCLASIYGNSGCEEKCKGWIVHRLKFSLKDRKAMVKVFFHAESVFQLILEIEEKDLGEIGAMVCSLGDVWREGFYFSLLSRGNVSVQEGVERASHAVGVVERHGLGAAYSIKPVLNGNDIVQLLGLSEEKKKTVLGSIMRDLTLWTYRNIGGSAESAREYLLGKYRSDKEE